MHTSWSHDCSIPPVQLLDHAEEIGLGGIAVTDHNVFGGALEAAELARDRRLTVIPGEEVKTDSQGEVIGLFLSEEIPRGMSFSATIAAIRAQGGLVYLPHPFDRLHAIPDPATLHRHLGDIDVFEVYNARLLFETYNDEALRFARKYQLTMGAGSDAHVLQGVGTGALRMRPFDGPEQFLENLQTAEVLRRPKSLAYLQSLKWVAQVGTGWAQANPFRRLWPDTARPTWCNARSEARTRGAFMFLSRVLLLKSHTGATEDDASGRAACRDGHSRYLAKAS